MRIVYFSNYHLSCRENVFQKVEGNQLENREENKMWLGRTEFNITYFSKMEVLLRDREGGRLTID